MGQLSGLLVDLGWNQAELSRRINVSGNTVSNWITGKAKTPKVVILYLQLLNTLKREVE